MDKAPNSYTNIDHQGLYSSTIPWDNAFDFAEEIDLTKIFNFGADADPSKIFDVGEEEDLSKIFDVPQEQHMNTMIIPSTSVENSSSNLRRNSENVSEFSNVIPKEQQPMTTTSIPCYSSTLDEDEDYSLSYIYSMGVNNVSIPQVEGVTSKNSFRDGINQENLKTFIPIPILTGKQDNTVSISRRRDQENPKLNDMILEQPLPKIPILEKLERESSLKSKFTVDQPLRISTNSWKKRENPKAKHPHMAKNPRLKRDFMKPTCHSNFGKLEQEKLMILNQGSEFMNSKFFMNHPNEISTSTKSGEQENPKTNGMILQRPMQHILTLEKIESHLMKSKQENVCGGNGILSCLDNEFPHKTRYSTQVAETGKQNYSDLVNHSNHNFQHSHTYTHEITNKFKGVATGQNSNEYTQGYGYSNQVITSRTLNNTKKDNEDGATDQLQSSWTQIWKAQDNHFNTTTNWPGNSFQ